MHLLTTQCSSVLALPSHSTSYSPPPHTQAPLHAHTDGRQAFSMPPDLQCLPQAPFSALSLHWVVRHLWQPGQPVPVPGPRRGVVPTVVELLVVEGDAVVHVPLAVVCEELVPAQALAGQRHPSPSVVLWLHTAGVLEVCAVCAAGGATLTLKLVPLFGPVSCSDPHQSSHSVHTRPLSDIQHWYTIPTCGARHRPSPSNLGYPGLDPTAHCKSC